MKLLSFFTVLVLLLLSACGCHAKPLSDLTYVDEVEIIAFTEGEKGQERVAYRFTDSETVAQLKNAVTSQAYRRVRITKPIANNYTIVFYDVAGVEVETVTLISQFGVVDCNGELYEIEGSVDLRKTVELLISAEAQP